MLFENLPNEIIKMVICYTANSKVFCLNSRMKNLIDTTRGLTLIHRGEPIVLDERIFYFKTPVAMKMSRALILIKKYPNLKFLSLITYVITNRLINAISSLENLQTLILFAREWICDSTVEIKVKFVSIKIDSFDGSMLCFPNIVELKLSANIIISHMINYKKRHVKYLSFENNCGNFSDSFYLARSMFTYEILKLDGKIVKIFFTNAEEISEIC